MNRRRSRPGQGGLDSRDSPRFRTEPRCRCSRKLQDRGSWKRTSRPERNSGNHLRRQPQWRWDRASPASSEHVDRVSGRQVSSQLELISSCARAIRDAGGEPTPSATAALAPYLSKLRRQRHDRRFPPPEAIGGQKAPHTEGGLATAQHRNLSEAIRNACTSVYCGIKQKGG
jgi:hypothetical protein